MAEDPLLQSDSPTISWPLHRPSAKGPWTPETDHALRSAEQSSIQRRPVPELALSNLPSHSKSLSGVSLRAFVLGLAVGLSVALLTVLLYYDNGLWRAPFFVAVLSVFHFLEYYITALYNTRYADISAFLLSSNGVAYNLAHTGALAECIITDVFFSHRAWLPESFRVPLLCTGLSLIVVGQFTRSATMAHAGSNFNHTVQTKRNDGHELVSDGIYRYLRHPSYFGFFWWGLGTQLVLGNVFCFVVYAAVLWRFFNARIDKEEQLLVGFFGREYLDYRGRTRVGIPFIS